jgi:homocysteine S-methyltransferase
VVGVALNPGSVDRERELSRFRWKVEAGADYAITQPVFEADVLAGFLRDTGEHRVPVLAGLWPFASVRDAEFLAYEVPGVVVPAVLLERMQRAQERGVDAARAEGVAIAREVLERVRDIDGVAGVHVGTAGGDVAAALELLEGMAP